MSEPTPISFTMTGDAVRSIERLQAFFGLESPEQVLIALLGPALRGAMARIHELEEQIAPGDEEDPDKRDAIGAAKNFLCLQIFGFPMPGAEPSKPAGE